MEAPVILAGAFCCLLGNWLLENWAFQLPNFPITNFPVNLTGWQSSLLFFKQFFKKSVILANQPLFGGLE